MSNKMIESEARTVARWQKDSDAMTSSDLERWDMKGQTSQERSF